VSRLSGPSFDRYDWRHFDNASAVVLQRISLADGAAITGTTEGIISASPNWAGSGTNTAGTGGFWYPGKSVRFTSAGRLTTPASAGTMTLNMRLDTITGASLGASGALAVIASQTNVSYWFEYIVTCRSVGTAGTLFGMGKFVVNPIVLASTAQPAMMPATGPTTATIDTTGNHQLVWTALFTATAPTITAHLEHWEALN
jgi:hypothetical protein